MGKLFSSLGRFVRAVFYTFAGDVSKWSEVWEASSGYINSEYDEIEKEQKTDITELTDAVAGLMEIVGGKEQRLEVLSDRIEETKKKKSGAEAKARSQSATLAASGMSPENIKKDATIQKCMDYHNSFSEKLVALEEEAAILEKELEAHDASLNKYKVRLQKCHKELENIKTERHETTADIKLSQQEQKINATLLGLSESKTGERRNRIQEMRRKNRAKADIQTEMAGLATDDAEDEFLNFATETENSSEFFHMLGLDKAAPAATEAPAETAHIPE